MSLQCGAHRRDLILVVVEFRIEAAASQPAEDGNQVYRHLAPSGGEFVEHLPGIFDRGARNPVQAGTKSCGRQHLRLHQPGRFVLRSKDPIFGARQRQQRSAADELGEIALVLCHRGIAPLLAQFGHLGRLAGHHPRAPGIGTQDATLLTLAGMVGIPTREQCGHLARPAAIGGRQPDHPNRHDRTVLARLRAGCEAGLELLDQCRQRRRQALRGGSFNMSNFESGWRARCWPSQPMISSISTGVAVEASTSVSSAVSTALASAAGLVTTVLWR